ncbi:MAG: sigma-54 interaction domain-containing protein [Thermacetogeniaceae bacterium]
MNLESLDREKLLQILDNSYDEIFVVDGKGTVIFVNKACERLYGIKASDIIGKSSFELAAKGLWCPSITPYILKEKKRISLIQETIKGFKLLVTATPVLDENGNVSMIVMNSRDVTEILKLQKELDEIKTRLTTNMRRYQEETEHLRQTLLDTADFVIVSKEMKEVFEVAKQVAPLDSNILILGESGTGKSLLAKCIHKMSKRWRGPFITLNCPSIPAQLFESELFGYDPGAFTGANKSGKPGLIELADSGTLFLDEIAEIPLKLQAKLLEVVEERKFIKVGGKTAKTVDIRIIAATNRDLKALVKKGLFREDLYYRLDVIEITIPPLRERRDDIMPLITYYLQKYNKKYGRKCRFSPEALEILLAYDYPGNARELSHIIERLVITVPEEIIKPTHIPHLTIDMDKCKDNTKKENISMPHFMPLEEAIKEVEKELVVTAHKQFKSSYKVAEALAISQSKAHRLIRKYCNKTVTN